MDTSFSDRPRLNMSTLKMAFLVIPIDGLMLLDYPLLNGGSYLQGATVISIFPEKWEPVGQLELRNEFQTTTCPLQGGVFPVRRRSW